MKARTILVTFWYKPQYSPTSTSEVEYELLQRPELIDTSHATLQITFELVNRLHKVTFVR